MMDEDRRFTLTIHDVFIFIFIQLDIISLVSSEINFSDRSFHPGQSSSSPGGLMCFTIRAKIFLIGSLTGQMRIQRILFGIIGLFWLAGSFFPSSTLPVMARADVSLPAQVNKEFVPNSISAGGVSTLRITIFNPNTYPLTLSTTPASLTDTLPAGVTFNSPVNPTTTCGGIVSTMGTTVSLIGGTVPAKVGTVFGSCVITADVTSLVATTHINTIPANNLKSTDPTGTIPVTNTASASNNLLVNAVLAPSVVKTFSNNTPYVGQVVTLTINIKNNDPTYTITDVSLTDSLPGQVRVANATVTKTNCGSPTVTGPTGNPLAANDASITISGASIAAGATCVVTANVTSAVAAANVNTILPNAITSRQGVTNASAASAPINFQSIGATKAFSPANFMIGGTSTFTITLRNPTSTPYSGVQFTDTLPTGLTINSAPASSQCGGTVTYDATHIYFADGDIPAGTIASPGTCTISAEITAAYTGSFTNSIPTGELHTDQGATNISPISGNVTVYASGLGISTWSKSFSPGTITLGGTSTLTINITAPADTDLTGFSITDGLPVGVVVAPTPAISKGTWCQGGTFNPAPGDTLLEYTGGTIPKTRQCTLRVNVTTSTTGSFTNVISPANVNNTEGRKPASSISATLTVSGIGLTKAFYPDRVNLNGVSTLTITLTNDNTEYLDPVDFTDTLPTGTNIAANPNIRSTCGSVSAISTSTATRQIIMNDGVVPAKVGSVPGVCTVNVDVVGLTTGDKLNRMEANTVVGTLHDSGLLIRNPARADAHLLVEDLTINVVKAFNPLNVSGGASSNLQITLSNPNASPLVGINFTDTMVYNAGTHEGMTVASPAHISTGDCGGTLSATPGENTFTFTGGFLAVGDTCTLSLDVTMNVEANLDNTIPAHDPLVPGSGVTSTNGGYNPNEAKASLTNLPGASITKYFQTNPITSGATNSTHLVLTIQNQSNFAISGVGFIDVFPAGMSLSGSLTPTQCNGGTVSYDGPTRTLSMSGGSLGDGAFCTIELDVTAPAVGTYENCIEQNALFFNGAGANDRACDTLIVEQGIDPPVISKNFSPDPVAVNTTSALTFTITNPNSVALTGVAFSDTFPAGLVVSSPPNGSQCGGLVTGSGDTVSLAGGTIAANGSCTVMVGTKSAAGGVYANTSGNVTSTNGGTGNTATDTLTVIAPPLISKSFTPPSIIRGGISTLTFTVTNPPENTVALTGVAFTDNLPAGMKVASSPNVGLSAECGAATFAPTADSTTLTFSGGVIPVSPAVCTASVDITVTNGGTYPNTSEMITSTNGGTGGTANATLTATGVGLTLLKSTTTPNFRAIGDTITYSYKLTNSGTAELYAPYMITDDKFGAPFACVGVSPLVSGAEITCTADYTVVAADVTSKSVTNTATAKALDSLNGDVFSNSSSTTVNLARLNLDKTTSSTGYTVVGDRIPYSYTLTNTGLVNLYAPFQVSDNKINGGTAFTCGTATILPPGGVTSCSLSTANQYAIVPDDLTTGFVTNTAVAGAMDAASGGSVVTSNTDSVTVYRLLPPVISKVFTPDQIPVGGTSTLTFTITNPNVLASLTEIAFIDNFPAGITRASDPATAQCGGTVASTATSISMAAATGGFLIPGGTCTVSIPVTSSTPGDHVNTSLVVSAKTAGNGNTATDTLTVLTAPVITKSFSPDTILENGTSTMTFRITNPAANTVPLTGVAFTDLFPAGLKVQNPPNATVTNCGTPTFAPAANDTGLNFAGATIDVGGTCEVTVDVTAPHGVYDNFTNPVSSANGGTGVKSNTARLTVNQAVDLSVTKTDGRLAVDRGESNVYTIVVNNAGPSAAVDAHVYDTIPSSLTGSSWTCTPDPGSSCTASGSGNISDTVTLPAGGRVTYSVSADVSGTASTSILNTASVVQPIGMVELNDTDNSASDTDGLNLLTMDKTAAESDYDTVGTIIHYNFKLTNSGTSILNAPFTVTDDRTTATCPPIPVSLNPGESLDCTGEYTIVQDDIDNGSVTNHAYGNAVDPDGDTVTSNTDTLIIASDQNQLLTLLKSNVSGDPYIHAGDPAEYSYVLANTGNVTLTGKGPSGEFTITDDKSTVTCPTTITKLLPTETVTCTSTYTITPADITAQSVTNRATGHALFGATDVNSNEDTVTINIKRGQIVGVVYLDANTNQSKEAAETVISGVTVDIYAEDGTTLLTTLTTDASGGFSYTNLLPGKFVVVEHDPQGYVSTTPNRLTVTVEPDGTARADYGEYRGGMTSNNQIHGLVYTDANLNGVPDTGEIPLTPVKVDLIDTTGTIIATTTTGTDGKYRFINLPPGVFSVVETNPGGYASTTLDRVSVTLSSGTDAEVNFGDVAGAVTVVDPAVTKAGTPAYAQMGTSVIFTITVGNNGATDAVGVQITDTLPDFLDLVNVTISPDKKQPVTVTGNVVNIVFGTVTPADSYTITIVTKVNALGAPPGGVNNVTLATTSMPEPVFNDAASARVTIYSSSEADMPETGFAPDTVTALPVEPLAVYRNLPGLGLEIPSLGVNAPIVGLSMQDNRWDVSWLGDRLAYLEETAFPTWNGNSVITGHVYKADGTPGPFQRLNTLRYGDTVVVHAAGFKYWFEVREVLTIQPNDLKAALKHQDNPWLTLMTCQNYDAENHRYKLRVLVRAVLMRVE